MILAEQIATYLYYNDLGIFSPDDTDGNIFIDRLPEGNEVLAIYNKPGGSNDVRNEYRSLGIQIIYRGTTNPIDSMSVASSIFESILLVERGYFIPGGNYVVGCISNQGGPERIGVSENEEFEYSMNFVIEIKI